MFFLVRGGGPIYSHVLVLGGTGMLKEVSLELASKCQLLSSIARTQASLDSLDLAIQQRQLEHEFEHRMLSLDWSNEAKYLSSICKHVEEFGPPSLVLAWLHQDSLGPKIIKALSTESTCEFTFVQVRGSSAADPASEVLADQFYLDIPDTVCACQIILGFIGEEGGFSRWLSNPEISSGVASALAEVEEGLPRSIYTVGQVSPYSDRP